MNEAKNIQTVEQIMSEELGLTGLNKLSEEMFDAMCGIDWSREGDFVSADIVATFDKNMINALVNRGLMVLVNDKYFCGWEWSRPDDIVSSTLWS